MDGSRFQVRLGDLAMVVVGSAYVLDVTRRSRVAWGGGWPDLGHALSLVVLTLGVGLILVVGREFRGFWGRDGVSRGARAWGLAWRALAIGWLIESLAEGSRVSRADRGSSLIGQLDQIHAEMDLRLIPLMTALGMVGLVLAVGPLRPRRASEGRARRSWPMVLLAGLGGLAIVAAGYGLLPYLVLLAMEAVRNALTRAPLVPHPSIFDRLARAGLETLPGLVGCLATGIWVDEDLRTASRDPGGARSPRSWVGTLARAAAATVAASGAVYVSLVSIPRLNPCLSEGIGIMFDGTSMAAVALGFATLAAGLAARPAARLATGMSDDQAGDPGEPPRGIGAWPRRIIAGMACLVALEVTAAALQAIRRDLDYRWYIPLSLDTWQRIFQAPLRWVGYSSTAPNWSLMLERPSEYLMIALSAWLAIRLVVLMAFRSPGRSSPLDALATDRLAFGRFLGWWAALTILMLASLPILAVAGVALTHFGIHRFAG